MKDKKFRFSAWCLLPVLGLVIACTAGVVLFVRNYLPSSSPGTGIPPVREQSGVTADTSSLPEAGKGPLTISLSEGQPAPDIFTALPLAAGEPISQTQVEAILARLPALEEEQSDQQEFRFPTESLLPPRPGQTIQQSFPPPPEALPPEMVAAGPLEVLRYAPEGEINMAPFVSLTFNQPMVPLTALQDLEAKDIPLKMEPELPGKWRWVGTKTLTFEYESEDIDRLPKATEYRLTVPAGTKSALGGVLAEAISWSFTTPPVKMVDYSPSGSPQPLQPFIFIAFDQRIDTQAMFDHIRVTAAGNRVPVKLATSAEIEADKRISNLVNNSLESRWLVIRPQEALPTDSDIQVIIGAGAPSAEGPLLSSSVQSFSFQTYAPLRIEEHGCSWYGESCPPLSPFFIRFNNPLDAAAYQEDMLLIDPELPGALVNIIGNTIEIRGASKGQTTYRVTISPGIRDLFGQTLGKSERLSFRVGSAEPFLSGPDKILVTLDPSASKPVLSLYAMNNPKLDVRIYAVQPSDWPAYKEYLRIYYQQEKPPTPPGRLVRDDVLTLESAADSLVEAQIDLSAKMDGKYGHFIVIVEPRRSLLDFNRYRYRQLVQTWVQITQIGLDAYADHSDMVVWTNALSDGKPLAGVTIQAGDSGLQVVSGEDGTARFTLPSAGFSYLTARQGSDLALLPATEDYWGENFWQPRPPGDSLFWYVFDDRSMYRPGEEVHLKGWLRRFGGRQDGDISLVGSGVTSINYQVIDSQNNQLGEGSAPVNALGGFDFVFTIPENSNLGDAQVTIIAQGSLSSLGGSTAYHSFQVQEFRRPEFEVQARNETSAPYFAGGHAVVAVSANYYAGGALPNAEVTWQVSSSPASYSPPNWPDFTFGTWVPWWVSRSAYAMPEYDALQIDGGSGNLVFSGLTDASGQHYLQLDFNKEVEPRPYSIFAEATVFDLNRQGWAGATTLLVHPANLYVGMRSERTFVERGKPLNIDLIVTDLEGNPVVDRPILATAARLEWKIKNGVWGEQAVDTQECKIGSALQPVTCTFETKLGGRYQITAQVSDDQGRLNQSSMTRWVSGGQMPPSRQVEQEEVILIPDKESYQPGDTAQVLVQPPFTPAEGLLTVARSGILYTQRFRITGETETLEIPIEAKHIPNLNIQVDLVGSAPRTDDQGETLPDVPPRPAYASGSLNLSIPPQQRSLTLELTPAETELEPGGKTTLDLRLLDASGEPVAGAELAVVIVDEAILALSNAQLADPLAVFYQQRAAYLDSRYLRSSIVLVDPQALADAANAAGAFQEESVQKSMDDTRMLEMPAAPMAAEAMPTMSAAEPESAGVGTTPIRVRIDFNPLALFAPQVQTARDGRASVDITLPDNLTRYRIMVVAVDASGTRFGSAETNMTARLPLMARPSAPRFLNFGDRFELPVIVQNQTADPLEVEVVIQTTNLQLLGSAGLRVTVPARDRIEVRFPAKTVNAGTARFQIAAVSGSYADAASGEMPVYTPATTEAFAVYGVVDSGATAQPIQAPSQVYSQFGGLEITTSSTALQALSDAVLYLVSYPFECTEQLSSRILAVAALRDVLTALSAEGLPSVEEMEQAVQRDIERLRSLQNYDGGFPYWRQGRESIPFNTIHVAHALQRAKLKGFDVPQEMLSRTQPYLRDIESYYPHWYSLRTRQTLSAYALYVRRLMGDNDPSKARKLLQDYDIESLSLEAVAWLWQVISDDPESANEVEAIRRHINNRAVETAGAANFTTGYDEQSYLLLESDRRADAIILDALINDSPQSDLIPKVVNGLLAHRKQGRWGNTQENVFVLIALDRYFTTYEAQTPEFTARIWLGDTYAGGHQYSGRTTERKETQIPMAYLVDELGGAGGMADLILSKEGVGRLYYRLGLRYAPSDLTLEPLDMGFVVRRMYEGVDDPEDVYRDAEGAWHIKAGARVRVRITMVADNRRYHVALADPLPAGLEIINPALAVSGSTPQDPNSSEYRYGWWWWGTWYEHQNLRDQRAEAFTSLLWDGVYTYSYVCRATTPGEFIVPPTKAEEMYSPEVFGRSGSDWVIIK